jgi:hypothetical protein
MGTERRKCGTDRESDTSFGELRHKENVYVFWDIAPFTPYANRRFGGTGSKIRRVRNQRVAGGLIL